MPYFIITLLAPLLLLFSPVIWGIDKIFGAGIFPAGFFQEIFQDWLNFPQEFAQTLKEIFVDDFLNMISTILSNLGF